MGSLAADPLQPFLRSTTGNSHLATFNADPRRLRRVEALDEASLHNHRIVCFVWIPVEMNVLWVELCFSRDLGRITRARITQSAHARLADPLILRSQKI